MIPLMVWLVRIPQHEAQATSLVLMLAPIGLPGVWVYARNGGGLPWLALGGVAAASCAGPTMVPFWRCGSAAPACARALPG